VKIVGARVLLTGGGSGIGRFLLDRLINDGAEVSVLELDESRCEELRMAYNGRVKVLTCDVSDSNAVDTVLKSLFEDGFEPTVLINNAGIIHSEPLVNLLSRGDKTHSRDSWRKVLSTNLDSVFFVTSRVVERMLSKRNKGVVISISSISANGNAGQSAYSAAKAGVNALTSAWAKELGTMGMRFVAIAPGFMDTPSTHAALSEAVITRLKQQIPLRRLGELESIYQAVRYAIENDYVSGTVLEVDGGLTL
jgi:3-oxoacyl-[acyl-carrier protein] reductase